MFSFIHSIYLIVLFHSSGVHRPFGLWYCIWNAAHKIFGGMCNPVIFGWYLVHLKSPITPGTHLILMWTFHIFICLIFSYILTVFSANSLHQSMVFLLHLHGLSLYWCRNSYFGFLLIHVWLFHLCVKSSLCVGWPVLPSHTWEWPTLGDLPI